jgi:hypothetical protein
VQPQGSSAFDRAAAIATRGATDAVADTNAKIYGGAYDTERANQQQAVGLSQQEVQTTINNLAAQALPRLIQQYGYDQGLEEYKTRLAAMLDVFKTAAGVAAPTIGQTSTSSSAGQESASSQQSSSGKGTSESTPGVVPTLAGMFHFGGAA